MKIKITLTDDDGKVYEREIDLNQNVSIAKTKSKVKTIKDDESFSGVVGGIRLLIKNEFLNTPKSVKEIVSELHNRGYYGKPTSIEKLLRVDFMNKKILTRIKGDQKWLYVIRK